VLGDLKLHWDFECGKCVWMCQIIFECAGFYVNVLVFIWMCWFLCECAGFYLNVLVFIWMGRLYWNVLVLFACAGVVSVCRCCLLCCIFFECAGVVWLWDVWDCAILFLTVLV
jgi:hypothetical protein